MLLSAQRTRPRPRPSSATDRVLVQRLTRGDEAAFSELFARYRSTVYATAYAVLLDPEQVAAVVTDSFDEARRSAAAFLDTRGTVSGWLTHLTRRRAAARLRSAGPLPRHAARLNRPASATPHRAARPAMPDAGK